MRLTTVILIAAIMQVSASGFAQKITLTKSNATLEAVINEIRNQSGFNFITTGELLDKAKPVSIHVKNLELEKVLAQIFANQPIVYSIQKNTVTLKQKASTFLDNVTSLFNQDTITVVTGRVLNEKGEPLSDATYTIEYRNGSALMASTDAYGLFRQTGAIGDILTVSYIGYENKRLKITKADLGDIRLKLKLDSLEEVKIVIGYGTTSQRLNTGNVSVVTSVDIAKQPVTNVLQALQGLVPGLAVNQANGFSSTPFNLKIRGQNVLATDPARQGPNLNSEPLYIIDGVPIISGVGPSSDNTGIIQNGMPGPAYGQSPLFGLNPSDVESISVLKDADATAIYGARGANGVILITTKKGKAGRTVIDANVNTGFGLQPGRLDLMNTEQYLAMRRQAFKNDNLTPTDGDAYDLTIWDQNRYTDWQKEFAGTARNTNAQLTLSGGSSNTTFRLSGGFNSSTPPYRGVYDGDFKEQRASGSLNLTNRTLNDKLTTTAMVNFSATTSNLPGSDLTSLIALAPNSPALFDETGHLNWDGWRATGGLPYNVADLRRPYNADTKNLISNLNIKYQILPGLDVNSSFGYNIVRQNQLRTTPSGSFDPKNEVGGLGLRSDFGINNSDTWVIEPTLNWNKTFGKHTLQALLGGTFQDGVVEGSAIYATGFISDAFLENLGAASNYQFFNNYAKTKFESVYARLNYNYSGKYILNLNGRRDGSSRFASGKQFGNFGSIGAAWIFSEEQFIKDHLNFLSLGKIRASYGLVGGDGLGDYQYLSSFIVPQSYEAGPYQGTPVFQLSRLANDQFSWMTNKKTEIGLELGFLNGRVNSTLSLYRNLSGDQLVAYPLPATTGFQSVTTNLGALIQNSGWELTLQTQNFNTKNFRWGTNINISRNNNKLLEFPDLENSSYADKYAIGRSISSVGMRHYTGVDPVTGFYTFADVNGDGTVDLFGNKDYIYKNNAPYFGGLNNSLSYKNLQVDFLLSFSKQQGRFRLSNVYPGALGSGAGNQLVLEKQLSGKSPLENLTTTGYRNDLYNYYASDATWVDASYIRLQNVSLAYNLPAKILSRAKLQNLRIYLQCQNLLTITNYKGIDPTNPDGGLTLPPRKIITAGIQITL